MARTGATLLESVRIVALNTVSVITTTGYALGDYTLWAPSAAGVFFLLMFIGGCSLGGLTCGAARPMPRHRDDHLTVCIEGDVGYRADLGHVRTDDSGSDEK